MTNLVYIEDLATYHTVTCAFKILRTCTPLQLFRAVRFRFAELDMMDDQLPLEIAALPDDRRVVFRRQGYDLPEYEDWPVRDANWLERLLGLDPPTYKNTRISPSRVHILNSELVNWEPF